MILNKSNIDYTKNPIFLGEGLALQRYDKFKYPEFFDLYSKQLSLFWRPEEFSLDKDRGDYKDLADHEKFIFTRNLLYQTMMDSVVSRGANVFTKYVTNPELEACMNVWQLFETIHSYSYTYIIKNVYAEPSLILDEALEDKEILARADSVSKSYDALNDHEGNAKSLKEQIYLSLIDVNILESVRFYVSFICAFAFAENKKMIGNADIIKQIRKDENCHYRMSQRIIEILNKEEQEGFTKIASALQDRAIEMFVLAAEEEKKWAEYLFQDGSILGLNEKILSQYIEWLTDTRMKAIGLPQQFGVKNPISWSDAWINPSKVQTAAQEQEISDYKISSSKNDISEINYDEL